MKIGLLSYPFSKFGTNLGDETQAIAAEQFLPRWDCYIEHQTLASYTELAEDIFLIANGYLYCRDKGVFPLGDSLKPLWTSLHIALHSAYLWDNLEKLDYFRPYQPIGCRDFATMRFLQKHNIEAYFSGCLTLTLKRENFNPTKREDILFVDILRKEKISLDRPFFKHRQLWGRRICNLSQKFNLSFTKKLILLKEKLLGKDIFFNRREDYKMGFAHKQLCSCASARFVVTSRLHVALPCLAFGTPVLFVYEKRKEGGDTFCTLDDPRFGGLLEHVTKIDRDSFYEGLEEGVWQIDGNRQSWEE